MPDPKGSQPDDLGPTTRTDKQGQPTAGSKPKTQWVVSGRDDDRVAIWEVDTAHPGGELFVAGKVPAEAALTAEVNLALREERLRPATDAEISKRQAQLAALEQPTVKGPWD